MANRHENDLDDPDSDSSVGSLEGMDQVDEEINRDKSTRAAGYCGQNSEIAWMRRLEDGVIEEGRQQSTAALQSDSTSETLCHPQDTIARDIPMAMMNNHPGDLDIPISKDIDIFAVPLREVADSMLT